ncbi:hypothetical protein HZA96_02090 [Candidatus Woesearchaeota archaeon]|nr:hypothetical protein [Candidatus Woesearchaeota archaeon]
MIEITFIKFIIILIILFSSAIAGLIISLLAPEELLQSRRYYEYIFPLFSCIFLGIITYSLYYKIVIQTYSFANVAYYLLFSIIITALTIAFYFFLSEYKIQQSLLTISIYFSILPILLYSFKEYEILFIISVFITYAFGILTSVYAISYTTIPNNEEISFSKKQFISSTLLLLHFLPFLVVGFLFYLLM